MRQQSPKDLLQKCHLPPIVLHLESPSHKLYSLMARDRASTRESGHRKDPTKLIPPFVKFFIVFILARSFPFLDGFSFFTDVGSVFTGPRSGYSVRHSRSRVSATLWGRYCYQIEQFMNKHKEGAVIIALQYYKINVFNGHRSLSNSMHATHILINEKLEEFMGFHEHVSGSNLKSSLIGSSSSSVKYVSSYVDPFTAVSITCISELLLSADESVHCIIETVLKVNTDKAWFYNACIKCKRKVEEDGETFYCNYYATPMTTVIPRFRLELVVIDDTAPANFTLFDLDAANFWGVSAEFMKTKAEKVDDDSMQSLAEFEKFLGIPFVFKVGVKLAKWSPTSLIIVQAMSWDQDLIKKLSTESPRNVIASEENGDNNIGLSSSQDVIAVDIFGDNLTPNQEADKFTLNQETKNPINAMDGRCLSFSEEVTPEDGYTTSSNKGISSEESNTKRRFHDLYEVNTVSPEDLKKVKLEKI
ncbi:replication protein A 70 kDa DNA-binding subunit C-like [Senna tora]|uniref:Replication protein A 70 kDa DNA-binding subunit C-like n=1 Tax=Senna tora TaxID=362788 RepID=A0A834TJ55_9FABA|nr:replication protein A 70 kDa DNA-binding subunit C-like [Senna tora]